MRAVAIGTHRYLPVFERLARRFAGSGLAPFFEYVVAHEQAIREAARSELGGREDSLAPVEALLGKMPPLGAAPGELR